MVRNRTRVTVHGEGTPMLRLRLNLNPQRYCSVGELCEVLASELQSALGRRVVIPPGTNLFFRSSRGLTDGVPTDLSNAPRTLGDEARGTGGGSLGPLIPTGINDASRTRRAKEALNSHEAAKSLEAHRPSQLTINGVPTVSQASAVADFIRGTINASGQNADRRDADYFANFILVKDTSLIGDGDEILIDEWQNIIRRATAQDREESRMRNLQSNQTGSGDASVGQESSPLNVSSYVTTKAQQQLIEAKTAEGHGRSSLVAASTDVIVFDIFNASSVPYNGNTSITNAPVSAFSSKRMSHPHLLMVQKLIRELMAFHIKIVIFLSSQCSKESVIAAQDIHLAQGQNTEIAESLIDEVTLGAKISDPAAALRAATQLAVQRGKEEREFSDGIEAEKMRQLASVYRARIGRLEEELKRAETSIEDLQQQIVTMELEHQQTIQQLRAEVKRLESSSKDSLERVWTLERANAQLQKQHREVSALNERLFQEANTTMASAALAVLNTPINPPTQDFISPEASVASARPTLASIARGPTPSSREGRGAATQVARRAEEERFHASLARSNKHDGKALLDASSQGHRPDVQNFTSPRLKGSAGTYPNFDTSVVSQQSMSLSAGVPGASLSMANSPVSLNTVSDPFTTAMKGGLLSTTLPTTQGNRMHWPAKEPTHVESHQPAHLDRTKPLHARSLVPKIAPSDADDGVGKRPSTSQSPGQFLQTGNMPQKSGGAILQVHIATATGQTHVARFEIPRRYAEPMPPTSPLISSLIAAMPKASSAHGQRSSMAGSPASIFSVASLQAQQLQLQQQMKAFYSRDLGGVIMQGSKNALSGRLDPSTSYITFYTYVMAQIKAWQHSAGSNIMGTQMQYDQDSPQTLLSALSTEAISARAGTAKLPAITAVLPALPNGAENDIAIRPDPEDPTTSFLLFFRIYYVRNGQRFPISSDKDLETFLAPSRGPVYTCNCVEITESTAEYLSAMMRRGELNPTDGQAMLSGRGTSRPTTGAEGTVPLALRAEGGKAASALDNMISFSGSPKRIGTSGWSSTLNATGVNSTGNESSIAGLGRNGVPIDEFGIPIGRGEKKAGTTVSEASLASSPSASSPAGAKRRPFFTKRANASAFGNSSPIDGQQSTIGAQGDANATVATEGQTESGQTANGPTDASEVDGAQSDLAALRSPLYSGTVSNNLFLHSAIVDVPSEAKLRRVYQQLYLLSTPLPRDLLDAMRFDRSNKVAKINGRYCADEDDFFAAGSDGDEANVNLYTTGMRSESLQVPDQASSQATKDAKDKDNTKDADEEEDPREAELRRLEEARRRRVTAAHVLRYLFKHHDPMGDPMRFWRLLEGVLQTHGISNGTSGPESASSPTSPLIAGEGGTEGNQGGAKSAGEANSDKRKNNKIEPKPKEDIAKTEHFVARERRGIDALRPVKLHTQITFANFVLIVLKLVRE